MLDAVVSGSCAAAGAVLGKVAFDGDGAALDLSMAMMKLMKLDDGAALEATRWATRAASLGGMLAMNAAMLHFYVKALSKSGSLVGTVTNTAVNIMLSSLLGAALFGEALDAMWAVGAATTLVGILVVQIAQTRKNQSEVSKIDKKTN